MSRRPAGHGREPTDWPKPRKAPWTRRRRTDRRRSTAADRAPHGGGRRPPRRAVAEPSPPRCRTRVASASGACRVPAQPTPRGPVMPAGAGHRTRRRRCRHGCDPVGTPGPDRDRGRARPVSRGHFSPTAPGRACDRITGAPEPSVTATASRSAPPAAATTGPVPPVPAWVAMTPAAPTRAAVAAAPQGSRLALVRADPAQESADFRLHCFDNARPQRQPPDGVRHRHGRRPGRLRPPSGNPTTPREPAGVTVTPCPRPR